MSTPLSAIANLPAAKKLVVHEANRQVIDVAPMNLPRERLAQKGVEALRDHELLAIVLGTGYKGHNVIEVARSLLADNPPDRLLSMSLSELGRLDGLGKVKASVLVAAFELSRRALGKGMGVLPTIGSPGEAVALLTEIKDQRKEFFLALYLNARNQVIHKEIVSIGSLSASIVHPREVFHVAVHVCCQHHSGAQPPVRRRNTQRGGFGSDRPSGKGGRDNGH